MSNTKEKDLAERQRKFVFEDPQDFRPVTRSGFVGADYILEQIDPCIQLLAKSLRIGRALAPDSILLSGPAGIGKTYTACLVATESNCRCVNLLEFPRSPSGCWTRENIKQVFVLCRAYTEERRQPIIYFLDQFDGFLNEEKNRQAVEQWCEEIDGIRGSPAGVFFIAATTEEPSQIDDQVLSRFSQRIEFEYPTRKGKALLLRASLSRVPHADFDIESLAHLLGGDMTPRAINGIIALACRLAEHRAAITGGEENSESKSNGGDKMASAVPVEKQDVVEAIKETVLGHPGPAAAEVTVEERRAIAIHEIGHAVAAYRLGFPVRVVNAIPKKNIAGCTLFDDDEFKLRSVGDMRDFIAVALASIAADKIAGQDMSAYRGEDLNQATDEALTIINHLAGGREIAEKLGPYAPRGREKSDFLMRLTERDAARILKPLERYAYRLLREVGKKKILRLADILCREKVLLRGEFEALMREHDITPVKPKKR